MSSRVIYIAGYGRSGSTVLGTLLSAPAEAVHVGEVAFVYDEIQRQGRICSCSENYSDCPFWSEVLRYEEFPHAENARLTESIEHISGLPDLLWPMKDRGDREAYGQLHRRFLDRTRDWYGADIIVDSSKSAWKTVGRFLALQRYAGQEVYVIHLIRSKEATLRSLLNTGSNWVLEGRNSAGRAPTTRAVIGWTAVNRLAARLGREMPRGRYLEMHYEDLVANPAEELQRISDFVDLDLSDVIDGVETGREFEIGHVVGGNRLRFDGTLQLRRPSETQGDEALRYSSTLA